MDRVRELWIFRTESSVTERFKNNDLHNEGTRKKLGEINPAKSPANSTLIWRNYFERAKDTPLSKQRCITCPEIEENLEDQRNDNSVIFKSLDGPKWPLSFVKKERE
jgi:hypothetical protein